MTFATGGRPLSLAVPQTKKLLKALYPQGNVPTEEMQRMMNAAHISLKQTKIIEKFRLPFAVLVIVCLLHSLLNSYYCFIFR